MIEKTNNQEIIEKTIEDINNMSYPDFLGYLEIENTPPGNTETIKSWISKSNLNANSYVLDLACSTGFSLRYLSMYSQCKGIGVDISEKSIQSAKYISEKSNLSDKIDFITDNAERLSFQDKSFTHIVAGCCFGFFSDANKALEECIRVLDSNGYLCVSPFYYDLTPSEELLNTIESYIGYKPLATRDYEYWVDFFQRYFSIEYEALFDLPIYTDDEIADIVNQLLLNNDKFKSISDELKQVVFDRYYNTRILLNENAKHQSVAILVLKVKNENV